jgi:endonuclease/exonuclease/phosphatase (EEP) superfamily protein YafD
MKRGRLLSTARRAGEGLALVLVWLCVAECTPAPVRFPAFSPAVVDTDRLSVLTHNVYYDPTDAEPTLRATERADADIVCLQEITSAWEVRLRRRFGATHPFVHVHALEGTGGMATLSRYPITCRNRRSHRRRMVLRVAVRHRNPARPGAGAQRAPSPAHPLRVEAPRSLRG